MDSIKRNRRAGPRVRVRSPDSGSVVMSSGSTVEMSSVTSERSHEEPMRTPVDFGNLANEHKTFPQRDEVQGGSTSSESSEQMSVSHHQAPSKRHRTEEEGPRDGFRTLDDEKRHLLLKLKRHLVMLLLGWNRLRCRKDLRVLNTRLANAALA